MLEISGSFATRWDEEWALAERIEWGDGEPSLANVTPHSQKRIIELFLDRMGPEIINVLLGRGAARYMFEVKVVPAPTKEAQ